jgi:hypothetical protein
MIVNNCSRCVSIFGVSTLAVMIVNNCSRCVSIFGVPALAVMIVNNCSRCVVPLYLIITKVRQVDRSGRLHYIYLDYLFIASSDVGENVTWED